MTTLNFRSPSGHGVALAEVLEESGIEYVKVEVGQLRTMMSDLGFTEEPDWAHWCSDDEGDPVRVRCSCAIGKDHEHEEDHAPHGAESDDSESPT